jgi:hypothetical protein
MPSKGMQASCIERGAIARDRGLCRGRRPGRLPAHAMPSPLPRGRGLRAA